MSGSAAMHADGKNCPFYPQKNRVFQDIKLYQNHARSATCKRGSQCQDVPINRGEGNTKRSPVYRTPTPALSRYCVMRDVGRWSFMIIARRTDNDLANLLFSSSLRAIHKAMAMKILRVASGRIRHECAYLLRDLKRNDSRNGIGA